MRNTKITELDSFLENNDLMAFAHNLARFRKQRSLTQMELAKRTKTGIAQLRRYEGGTSSPTLEVIVRLARTLGVSSDELIFEEGKGVASARLLDRELLERFEIVSHLAEEDRNAIKRVLDAFIIRSQMEEAMKRATAERKAS